MICAERYSLLHAVIIAIIIIMRDIIVKKICELQTALVIYDLWKRLKIQSLNIFIDNYFCIENAKSLEWKWSKPQLNLVTVNLF